MWTHTEALMIRSAFLMGDYKRPHQPGPFHANVSVIIPYGGGKEQRARLEMCLRSLRWQRYHAGALDIIVVHVCRPDEKPGMVATGITQLVVRREYDHFPLCWARNVGARAARGDVLAFIDADVVLDPEFVVRALRHPRDLVTCWMSYLEEGHDPITGPDDVRNLVPQGRVIRASFGGGIVAPRDAVCDVHGFDEVYDRAWGADDNDMIDRLQRVTPSWYNLTEKEQIVNLHQYHPTAYDPEDPGTIANRQRYYSDLPTIRNENGWGQS